MHIILIPSECTESDIWGLVNNQKAQTDLKNGVIIPNLRWTQGNLTTVGYVYDLQRQPYKN